MQVKKLQLELFSIVAVLIYTPTSSVGGFFSPHPFQNLVCRFLMMAICSNMDESEIVILSEVSQTQKDKYHVSLTCVCAWSFGRIRLL